MTQAIRPPTVSSPLPTRKIPTSTTATVVICWMKNAKVVDRFVKKRARCDDVADIETKPSHSSRMRLSAPMLLIVSRPLSDSTSTPCLFSPSFKFFWTK